MYLFGVVVLRVPCITAPMLFFLNCIFQSHPGSRVNMLVIYSNNARPQRVTGYIAQSLLRLFLFWGAINCDNACAYSNVLSTVPRKD
jgi:hypothetical protein